MSKVHKLSLSLKFGVATLDYLELSLLIGPEMWKGRLNVGRKGK